MLCNLLIPCDYKCWSFASTLPARELGKSVLPFPESACVVRGR